MHNHVCGHASLSDILILQQRNIIWCAEVEKYLNRVVSSSTDCAKTHYLKQLRKVSLRYINRSFNKVVCMNHFHIDNLPICHLMVAVTRYSAGDVVKYTGMEAAIVVLYSHWISPFGLLTLHSLIKLLRIKSSMTSYYFTVLILDLFQHGATTNMILNRNTRSQEIFSCVSNQATLISAKILLLSKPFAYQMIFTAMIIALHMN